MNNPNACTLAVSESNLLKSLKTYGKEQAKFVARNPKLLKATFDLLKAVQSSNILGGSAALISGTSAGVRALNMGQVVQDGAQATAFSLGMFKSSMELTKVVHLTSTGAVLVYIGATTVQKTGIALSLAGDDAARAKCAGAIMELAGSLGVAAASAPTGILLILAFASLTASVINTGNACKWFG